MLQQTFMWTNQKFTQKKKQADVVTIFLNGMVTIFPDLKLWSHFLNPKFLQKAENE